MKRILAFVFLILSVVPAYALKHCPRCHYAVSSEALECPKCLKILSTDFSEKRVARASLIVRRGHDAFIRHPHADNRAYKASRNAGGHPSGQIGSWGGPGNLRYLVRFDIEGAMDWKKIASDSFKLKKAFLHISAMRNKEKVDMPIAVYALTTGFMEGTGKFRESQARTDGTTWTMADVSKPWHSDGGDYAPETICRGVIKNGERCIIDVTKAVQYIFDSSREEGVWMNKGLIIMSDPTVQVPASYVTIYSLDALDYTSRPELYLE